MKQTIAQQLNVKKFPFEIKDDNQNVIYYEYSDEYWVKQKFDKNNNRIYFEDSNEYWVKYEFDKNNNRIYFNDSNGFWVKLEYDDNNNEIYYENLRGNIRDNRPKPVLEVTMKDLEEKYGCKVKVIK